MEDRASVIGKIDKMIDRLSGSIPSEEAVNGWNEDSRQAMLNFFRDLRERMQRGESPKVTDVTIARGLDHWGIGRGQLLDEAVDISNSLRPWYQSHR